VKKTIGPMPAASFREKTDQSEHKDVGMGCFKAIDTEKKDMKRECTPKSPKETWRTA